MAESKAERTANAFEEGDDVLALVDTLEWRRGTVTGVVHNGGTTTFDVVYQGANGVHEEKENVGADELAPFVDTYRDCSSFLETFMRIYDDDNDDAERQRHGALPILHVSLAPNDLSDARVWRHTGPNATKPLPDMLYSKTFWTHTYELGIQLRLPTKEEDETWGWDGAMDSDIFGMTPYLLAHARTHMQKKINEKREKNKQLTPSQSFMTLQQASKAPDATSMRGKFLNTYIKTWPSMVLAMLLHFGVCKTMMNDLPPHGGPQGSLGDLIVLNHGSIDHRVEKEVRLPPRPSRSS